MITNLLFSLVASASTGNLGPSDSERLMKAFDTTPLGRQAPFKKQVEENADSSLAVGHDDLDSDWSENMPKPTHRVEGVSPENLLKKGRQLKK